MTLNYIWVGFFLIAFVVAMYKWLFLGDTEVFNLIMTATFDRAKLGFELSLGLTGVLVLWMGIMKIGEKGGMIKMLTKMVSPFFSKLFPEIPKDHPAMGSMMMNLSANMLGLDNAATPLGLKAMKDLQSVNSKKEVASNAQIMFLVLNTSGMTLIPVSILALRASAGAVNPTDVFVPILLATFISTMVGLLVTAFVQRINLLQPVVLSYLLGFTFLIAGLIWYFISLSPNKLKQTSNLIANFLLFTTIIVFILSGVIKKINIYDTFIDGAKEGFGVAIGIIPYLVAMLVAIGVFTASGTMDWLIGGLQQIIAILGIDTRFVEGLPIALMKPLSGGGARALMVESWGADNSLVDSFVGRLTSTLQGSTETTFYVLAVYFGSINIKNTRNAALLGIIADLSGVVAAICLTYLFFG